MVKKFWKMDAALSVRLFSAASEKEFLDGQMLTEAQYIVTDGKDLGEHENSLYGMVDEIYNSPVPNRILGHFGMLPAGKEPFVLKVMAFARKYAPADFQVCRFNRPLTKAYIIINQDPDFSEFLKNNEDIFDKITPSLETSLGIIGKFGTPYGLFTSGSETHDWHVAHNILMPAFSMKGMREYFPIMRETVGKMIGWWSSLKPKEYIDIPDAMTRMALEAIGVAGFNYSFKTLSDFGPMHPFVTHMTSLLKLAQDVLLLRPLQKITQKPKMMKQLQAHGQFMKDMMAECVQNRIDSKERKTDILDLMLNASDPESGERLSMQSIYDQLITFLVAGHETTSGSLAFLFYLLAINPHVLEKLIAEVDKVMGKDLSKPIEWKHLSQFKYMECVVKEVMRLFPTAPAFYKIATRDFRYKKYKINKGTNIITVLMGLQRNPKTYKDPEKFIPERWFPGEKNHGGGFFSFGMGKRSCIGMQFAHIEQKIVITEICRRWRLVLKPGYVFGIASVLTIRPADLFMYLDPRDPKEDLSSQAYNMEAIAEAANATANTAASSSPFGAKWEDPSSPKGGYKPVNNGASTIAINVKPAGVKPDPKTVKTFVYHGGNMGSCKNFATHLVDKLHNSGVSNAVIKNLDDIVEDMKRPEPCNIIVVTATYNGNPPDNAVKAAAYLSGCHGNEFGHCNFGVFGCGNIQWKDSYQSFPEKVDRTITNCGGHQLLPRGIADADGDFDDPWDKWEAAVCALLLKEGKTPSTRRESIKLDNASSITGHFWDENKDEHGHRITCHPNPIGAGDKQTVDMIVEENREVLDVPANKRSTRHIAFKLPPGSKYTAGDHLGVWSKNPTADVEKLARRLSWDLESVLTLKCSRPVDGCIWPLNVPITVKTFLTDYVDINGPVSRRAVQVLSLHTECPPEADELAKISDSNDSFKNSSICVEKRTIYGVLMQFKSVGFDLNTFLIVMNPTKVRYYSISSSPMLDGNEVVHLTVSRSIWEDKSGADRDGVASTYLAQTKPGDIVRGYTREAPKAFHLPQDNVPIIMVGPGTGFAPFRGFIRERQALAEKGHTLAESVLFFGCRKAAEDHIYRDETAAMAPTSNLVVHNAYSRDSGDKVYVQDLIAKEKEAMYRLIKAGANIYVCGDGRSMSPAVKAAFIKILDEKGENGADAIKAMLSNGHYTQDVWA